MPLVPGARLGPYEIIAPLGAGGMGEVYKARDTRLDRTVAIKIVSDVMTASPDARARMEREARAISRLNHPNICTLYDIGSDQGTDYLVLEYIEGETLAARIAAGPLPIDEALRIGTQICDGLDRAHRAGFVHRDLKPANVMLTKGGAKLLDFGLAKESLALQAKETVAGSSLSGRGTLAGTLHYMAPEQVEGREADARTDIFAFGVVMHEMLTGERAFTGSSPASVISAILRDAPPKLQTRVPALPIGLDRVVRRCLEKDPDERWQSARDILFELRDVTAADLSGPPTVAVPERRPALLGALALVSAFAVAATAAAVWLWTSQRAEPGTGSFHLDIVLPDGYQTRNDTLELSLSPDSRFVAIALLDSQNTSRIFVRSVDDPALRAVPGTENGMQPFWSPDGRRIGFFADGWLQHVLVDGGVVQRVTSVSPEPRGGVWSDDDTILYSPQAGSSIMSVPAGGGTPTAVTTAAGGSHRYPAPLPGGRFLYFSTAPNDKGVDGGSRDGSAPQKIVEADSRASYSNGRLLFVRNGSLLSQRFDPVAARTNGEPELIAPAVDFGGPPGAAAFSASPAGMVAYSTGNRVPIRNVIWRDRRGTATSGRMQPQRYSGLALSPDDRQLALTNHERLQSAEIWLLDVERGVNARLSPQNRYDWFPVWAPDGRLFFRVGSPTFSAELVERQSGGQERAMRAPVFPTSTTRDGKTFVGHETAGKAGWDVSTFTDGRISPLISTPHNEMFPVISPDGRWIAWMSDESGPFDVYVASYPDLREKQRIGTQGAQPSWRADGRELYFLGNGHLMAVPVESGERLRLGPPVPLFAIEPMREASAPFARLYAPASDGQRFVLLEPAPGAMRTVISVVSRTPAR